MWQVLISSEITGLMTLGVIARQSLEVRSLNALLNVPSRQLVFPPGCRIQSTSPSHLGRALEAVR
jgi:hypothetical protein